MKMRKNEDWLVSNRGRCVAPLIALMLVGLLWPGQLSWNNELRWYQPGPGIEFPGIAQALSERPIVSRTGALTLELWLVPGFISNAGNQEIVSFYDEQWLRPLVIGQFDRGFILRGRKDNPTGDPRDDRYLELPDLVQTEPSVLHHLAVTVGSTGARLHINGRVTSLILPQTVARPGKAFGGHLMLGSSNTGWRVWRGGLSGMAIYERVLGRAELLAHAADRAGSQNECLRNDPSLLALYRFEEGSGLRARSAVAKGPDLIFPDRMTRPTRPNFFSYRISDPGGRAGVQIDVVQNILGFVPLGFVLGWHKRARGIAAALAIGFALSFGAEFCQSLIPGRDSSLIDLASNSLGALMGALLSCAGSRFAR